MKLPFLEELAVTDETGIIAWFEHPVTQALFSDLRVAQAGVTTHLTLANPEHTGQIGRLQGKIQLYNELAITLESFLRQLTEEDDADEDAD